MSELNRVANVLRSNTTGIGLTAAQLAKLANVPKSNVYKRVHDLRRVYGTTVYSNFRNYNGRPKMFYMIG